MGNFFKVDGPIVSFLNRATDLVWLNILFVVFSIPIITVGASTTAMYYVAMKLVRNEEGYVTKDFFKAFKSNFKQATLIWLIILSVTGVLGLNAYLLASNTQMYAKVIFVIVCMLAFTMAMMTLYVFPLLARFDNTIKNTMLNAFLLSVSSFPKTILMLIFALIPALLLWFDLKWFPLCFFGGASLVAYSNAFFMVKIFKKMEPETTDESDNI